jgi:hypothetical protein
VSDEPDPTRGHLILLGVYMSVVAAAGVLLRDRRRLAVPKPQDIVLLGIGTFKLSRIITRERVTQAIREPFAEVKEAGTGSEIIPAPRGKGLRRAIGELLSCPFCASVWIGTAASLSYALAPEPTRLAASALSTMTVADAAQYGLAALHKVEG